MTPPPYLKKQINKNNFSFSLFGLIARSLVNSLSKMRVQNHNHLRVKNISHKNMVNPVRNNEKYVMTLTRSIVMNWYGFSGYL